MLVERHIASNNRRGSSFGILASVFLLGFMAVFLLGCADVNVPGTRNVNIPSPVAAEERQRAINERPDSVLYLPLGDDVLVPETNSEGSLPTEIIGPFELRSETLAGALQLILADYEVPLAFETEEGLTRTITVANLRGPLDRVVKRVCGLADLYCAFEDGVLVVKETQTFTVSIPPVGGDNDIIDTISSGLSAITGESPIIDSGTRTLIYTATQRTAELAERYFQRMRRSTALIVFEIYIWEVSLNAGNSTGIDWEKIDTFGKFNAGVSIPGGASADFTPISIGLPTTGSPAFGSDDILEFISDYGAVKTISQPQVAMLSSSEASLRVADTVNYVSSLERTVDNGETSVSTQTDSVDTGFTLTIGSAWDNATIYGSIEINLQEFRRFQEFDADGTTLQLPETTERELQTQVRIRPGDSLLIAGLVRENDEFNSSGPGFMQPFTSTSREATTNNVELVFLLRPRVVVYRTGTGGGSGYEKDFNYNPDFDLSPDTDITYGFVEPVLSSGEEHLVPASSYEPEYDLAPSPLPEPISSADDYEAPPRRSRAIAPGEVSRPASEGELYSPRYERQEPLGLGPEDAYELPPIVDEVTMFEEEPSPDVQLGAVSSDVFDPATSGAVHEVLEDTSAATAVGGEGGFGADSDIEVVEMEVNANGEPVSVFGKPFKYRENLPGREKPRRQVIGIDDYNPYMRYVR